ncbi:MAG: response regulator [Sphingomonas sp.]
MGTEAIVHIVDDDDSLRQALVSLFRSVGLAAREHASVAAFLEAERGDAPGCLVLDVRLPGISGLDFQDRLAALGIGCRWC